MHERKSHCLYGLNSSFHINFEHPVRCQAVKISRMSKYEYSHRHPDHGGGVNLLNSTCEQIVCCSNRATFQKRERKVRKPKYTTN